MNISVIIPTYNHGKYISEAIDSVLSQICEPFEIIVIDDGSTDNTTEIIKPYLSRIQYLQQKNGGISSARNTGIQQAKGNYLAFLDADDKWSHDKLQRQIQAMQKNPELDMVFGHVQQFYCPQISMEAKAKIKCPDAIIPAIIPPAMLIKASSFHRVGYFDLQWTTGEFIDWYIKAQAAGLKGIVLNDLILYRRIHDGHANVRQRRNYQDYLHILRKKLHAK